MPLLHGGEYGGLFPLGGMVVGRVSQKLAAVGLMMPPLLPQQASPLASASFGDTLFPEVWPLLWTSLLSISSAETGQNI